MWNTQYNNRLCFIQDKIREQRLHLERLFNMQPVIIDNPPFVPKFLQTRLKKEEIEKERQNKIFYENMLLTKKIAEVELKPSYYNSKKLHPKIYPAFKNKKNFRYNEIKKQEDIDKSNFNLLYRITELKSNYDAKKFYEMSKKDKKYKNNISKAKSNQNPYLNFETPEEFKRKLEIQLENELFWENNNRNVNHRPKSGFTGRSNKTTTKCTTTVNNNNTNILNSISNNNNANNVKTSDNNNNNNNNNNVNVYTNTENQIQETNSNNQETESNNNNNNNNKINNTS